MQQPDPTGYVSPTGTLQCLYLLYSLLFILTYVLRQRTLQAGICSHQEEEVSIPISQGITTSADLVTCTVPVTYV